MKVNNYVVFFLSVSMLHLFGCKKNDSPVEINNTNLIMNSSFELNGQPSLKYWYVQDSSKISFSNDVPVGGGKWSIYIHTEWYGPLPKSPSYFVPLSPGKHIVKFSLYGKSKSVAGSAFLILHKGDERKISAQNLITDSSWTRYSTIDTLNINEGDSLFVLLYGGGTEVIDGITYFDLVELELIDGD